MTPTDAQIEAAANAMYEASYLAGRKLIRGDCRVLARLALTAALQTACHALSTVILHGEPEHTEPVGMVTPAAEL